MSKCKITGKKLVIQLGRTESRVALMNGGNLLHSKTYDTPAGAVEDGMIRNQESVRELLKTITKEPEFKGVRQTVFVLSTSQVITETVAVPDLPASRLEKLLQTNVDMYFPVDMRDYQLVWQVVGPKPNENGSKEVLVQLWAMPVNMLSRYYQVANTCGLSVVAIDYIGNSIAGAIGAGFTQNGKSGKEKKKLNLNAEITLGKKKAEPAPAEEETSRTKVNPATELHLLLEQDILGMTFVQNGQIVVQRFIRCGSDPVYQFGELAMMLEYFRAMDIGRGSTVRGIASGALAEDPAMVKELELNLGIPVEEFSASYDLGWLLCVGAGNTALDFGIPSLNKPSTVRLEFQRQIWQYGVLLCGILAVLFVVLTLLTARLGWTADISALKNTQQMLTIQNSKVAGYSDNYQEYKAQYDAYNADWNNIFDTLRFPNNNLVLILEELEALMPQEADAVNMQIDQSGLSVTFACDDKEVAAYLISALDEMEYATLQRPVSDLYGGGGGPADTYGSGAKKEAAPVEGSGASYGPNASQEPFLREAFDMSDAQLDALRSTYGKTPANSGSKATSDVQKRSDAIGEMLTTNPYAVKICMNLLMADYEQGTGILADYIIWDIMKLGFNDLPNDYDGAQAYAAKVLPILTRSDVLDKTEALMLENSALCEAQGCKGGKNCDHKYIGKTYLHYLDVQAGTRSEEDFPYLNVASIEKDVQNGGAKTSDATVNDVLNELFYKEPEPTEPPVTEPPKPVVPMSEELKSYLVSGTTSDPQAKQTIEKYLMEGPAAVLLEAAQLNACVEGGNVDALLEAMLTQYREDATKLSAVEAVVINNYLTSTGNTVLNARLRVVEASMPPVETEPVVTEPVVTEPVVTEPVVTEPVVTEPVVTEPVVTEPIVTEPVVTEPVVTEPVVTEPTETEPGATEPTQSEMLLKLVQAFMGYWKTGKVESDDFEPKERAALKLGFDAYLKDGHFESLKELDIPEHVEKQLFDEDNKKLIDLYFNNYMLYPSLSNYILKGMDEKNEPHSSKVMNDYFTQAGVIEEKYGHVQKQIGKLLENHAVKKELKDQITWYRKNQLQQTHKVMHDLLTNYEKNDTTDILPLDQALRRAFEEWFTDRLNEQNKQAAQQAAAQAPLDTHIYFTARLNYKEEFLEAERSRKGLDVNKKVEEQFTEEVGE